MLFEFMQYLESGKHAMEFAIVQAIPGVFTTAFGMITSGDRTFCICGWHTDQVESNERYYRDVEVTRMN